MHKLISHICIIYRYIYIYIYIYVYIPKVNIAYTVVTWLVFRLKSHAINGIITKIIGRTQASANAHIPHNPTIKQ